MKNLLVVVLALLSITACKNDSVNPSTEGVWVVSYYLDSGKNETSDFAGYTFEFGKDGVFTAKFSGNTRTGTWSEKTSSNKLVIDISGTERLDDVSDDWLIIKKTDSLIELKDDNSSGEVIHFKKQ